MRAFFADLWAKIRADVLNATALIGTILGSFLSHIDALAAALGDPTWEAQVRTSIGDAKWFGRYVLMVGILATIARFKKLVQSPR